MKKELVSFSQFILIAGLAGYGYFGLLLLQGRPILLFYGELEHFFLNWILTFVVLSFIRLALYYLYFRKESYDSAQVRNKDLIGKEASRTIQYLILAVVAIPISFNLSLPSPHPDISYNYVEMWLGVKGLYFAWLIGFFILSLLRLGIIYLKNKPFAGQID